MKTISQTNKTDAQNVVNNQQKSDLKAYKNLYEGFISPLSWKIDHGRMTMPNWLWY